MQRFTIEVRRKRRRLFLWDVFISHASEDKKKVARPLAEELEKRGLQVFYDKFSLRIGDDLRESIDRGLRDSTFGVVILSKSFFARDWPKKELEGLIVRERNGKKVILPVWHEVTHDDVANYSLIIAGKLAVNTDEGIETVVDEIMKVFDEDNFIEELTIPIQSKKPIYPSDKFCMQKIEEISKWIPPTTKVINEAATTGDYLKLGINCVLLKKYLASQKPILIQATKKAISKKALAKEFVSALKALYKAADLHEKAVDCFHKGEIDSATEFMIEGRRFNSIAKTHIENTTKFV